MSFGTVQHKHERLANHLRELIATGQLRPGDQIPSQNQLMTEHGLSYGTVRRTLTHLQTEGVLEGRVGEGIFVTDFNSTREARIAELIRSAPPLSKEAISRLRALLRQGA